MARVGANWPLRWQAQWIWCGQTALRTEGATARLDPEGFDRYVLVRRVLELASVPPSAPMRVAGDSRFVVWVNGHELLRGPVRCDPRQLRREDGDAAPFLVAGANAIAILARYYGHPTSWWLPAPLTLGLGGGCIAAEIDLGDFGIVGTDDRWRVHPGDAWAQSGAPEGVAGFLSERLDARELPHDWTAATFDDHLWSPATVLPATNLGTHGASRPPTDPYGALPARPVPPLSGRLRRPTGATSWAVPPPCAASDGPRGQVQADQAAAAAAGEAGGLGADGVVRLPARPAGEDGVEPGAWLVIVDFGETVAGRLRLDLTAPEATRVDCVVGEELDDQGLLRLAVAYHQLSYVARGRDDHFLSFDPVGGRYLALSVRAAGAVELKVGMREDRFPRDEASASFRCSDAVLEEIFAVGLRTVDLCAQDAYLDCPTREQRAWTGDSVVHQSVHLATSDDWSLALWHPQLTDAPRSDGMLPMAAVSNIGGRPDDTAYIPDWPLHWIRSVHNLMRYSGDRELVAQLLGSCEAVLRWFLPYQGQDGLLSDVPGWVLIDWSNVAVADTSAALNALWARGLRDFERMARWLGDQGRAGWAAGVRARVAAGFELFWDGARGAYHDQRLDGVVQRSVSRHVNAAAVVGGLVPAERLERVAALLSDRSSLVHSVPVMEVVASDPEAGFSLLLEGNPAPDWDLETGVLEAQPFFRYVVHDALAEAGRADLVADACRDWKAFLDAGERTWPETWAGGTHCHGWSSTPTRDLIVYTLGIGPAEPGFGVARVAPRLGDLAWAEATVPVPAGRLHVRATPELVELDTPVPTVVDVPGGGRVAPGSHRIEIAKG